MSLIWASWLHCSSILHKKCGYPHMWLPSFKVSFACNSNFSRHDSALALGESSRSFLPTHRLTQSHCEVKHLKQAQNSKIEQVTQFLKCQRLSPSRSATLTFTLVLNCGSLFFCTVPCIVLLVFFRLLTNSVLFAFLGFADAVPFLCDRVSTKQQLHCGTKLTIFPWDNQT